MIQPHNIWCIGRNFREHAAELNNSIPDNPMVFLKAGSCFVDNRKSIQFPNWLGEIHHEVELAVFFNDQFEITEGAVALDLTARTIQADLKKKGHPWTLAKSFPQACPIGPRFPIKDLASLQSKGEIRLLINQEARQRGYFRDMVFGISDLATYVRNHFPVVPGDALLTGTPAGVGPIRPGDELVAEIPGLSVGTWSIQ